MIDLEGLQKRCYVSGPMTGLPELNFPTFHAAAERLQAAGWDVVNPATLNATGTDWDTCMRVDICELMRCSVVFALPGWTKSRGAPIEIDLAINLGMKVLYLHDYEGKQIPTPDELNKLMTV